MRQSLISEHFAQSKPENEPNSSKPKPSESSKRPNSVSAESLQRSSNTCKFFDPHHFSQKTLKLIQRLEPSLKSSQSLEADLILNTISMREKYKDLLKSSSEKSLALPYKYKKLLKSLKLLDYTINNSRLYNISMNFQKIQQVIWMNYRLRVELEQVQKINFMVPKFYLVSWDHENLSIDIPETGHLPKFIIHSRYLKLKHELISRVKVIHSAFLNTQMVIFDPDVSKTWHSTFNLHNVPDIPSAPLPDKPNLEIKGKNGVGKQLRATRLIVLCKMLIKIFNNTQTPSLFLKSLVKIIQKEKWSLEDPKNIEMDLEEIQEIFGFWIDFIDTESGRVVRVNKQSEFCFQTAWHRIKSRYKS